MHEHYEEYNASVGDGIDQYVDGFYFWDEVGAERYGPYDTKEEALKKAKEYGEWLDGQR